MAALIVRPQPRRMIKSGTAVASILGLIWAGIHISRGPVSDSLGITQALMPLTFPIAWFFFSCLLWTPCLLAAILFRAKATPEPDVERAWNIFTASLLPFAVCLCMVIPAVVKNRSFLP